MDNRYSVIVSGITEPEERDNISRLLKEQSVLPAEVYFAESEDVNTGINKAMRDVKTAFVWILSGKALLEQPDTAEKMLSSFSNPEVAAVYSGQRSGKKGSISDAYQAAFFPEKQIVKEEKDIYFHGMETFFISNTSCMYRMADLKDLPPFEPMGLSFSEHVVAANLIHLGKKIVYEGNVTVKASHKLTPRTALHEGFDYGVLGKRDIQAFGYYVVYDVMWRTLSQTYRNARRTACGYLVKNGAFYKVPGALLICLCLNAGCKLGRRYHRLPAGINRALCSDKNFFVS